MIMPMTESNYSELFLRAVEAMNEWGFQVTALAEGDTQAQKKCFDLVEQCKNFKLLESTEKNKTTILEGIDILLFPSTPEKKDIQYVIKNGIIPVLPEGNGLRNFNAQDESGEAFAFTQGNFWSMVAALLRASENHKFPYDWKNIQQNLKEVQL